MPIPRVVLQSGARVLWEPVVAGFPEIGKVLVLSLSPVQSYDRISRSGNRTAQQ